MTVSCSVVVYNHFQDAILVNGVVDGAEAWAPFMIQVSLTLVLFVKRQRLTQIGASPFQKKLVDVQRMIKGRQVQFLNLQTQRSLGFVEGDAILFKCAEATGCFVSYDSPACRDEEDPNVRAAIYMISVSLAGLQALIPSEL